MPTDGPSYQRRQALRDADSGNVMKVISSYPLEKYFHIADRLLIQFQQALDERRLDETYVYGIRFATFCLESLPEHPHYKSKERRLAKQKLRNARQVDTVLKRMEIVTQRMDFEELIRQSEEQEKEKLKQQERERLAEEEDKEKQRLAALKAKEKQRRMNLETQRKQMEQQKIEQSAYAKLQAMQIKMGEDRRREEKQEKLDVPAKNIQTLTKTKQQQTSTDKKGTTKKIREKPSKAFQTKEMKPEPEHTSRKAKPPVKLEARIQEGKKSRLGQAEKSVIKNHLAETPKPKGIRTESERKEQQTSTESKKGIEKKLKLKPTKDPQTKETKPEPENTSRKSKSSVKSKPHIQVGKKSKLTLSEKSGVKNDLTETPKPKVGERPLTEEERTITLLADTIEKQETRLVEIEETRIPALLHEAKLKLKSGDRKAALQCLAKKKKLDSLQDVIKGAIFHMETQMFMLENAMEDRQVQDALKAYTQTMQGLQATVGVDPTTLQQGLEGFLEPNTAVAEFDFDEDELVQELEQWTTPQKKTSRAQTIENEDEISILSLPEVPAKTLSKKGSIKSSARSLLKAVLG